MSISDMPVYAELQRQGETTLPERVEMLKALRDNVETCMAELHRNLELVCYKIDRYSEIIEKNQQTTP